MKPVEVYCAGGMTTAFPVGSVLLCGAFAIGHDMAGRVRIKPLNGGSAMAEPLADGVKLVTRRDVDSNGSKRLKESRKIIR